MREVAPDWPAAGMQSDDDWLWLWRGAQERAVKFRSVLKARIDNIRGQVLGRALRRLQGAAGPQHFQALAFLLGSRRALCSLAGVEPPVQPLPKQQGKKKVL